MKICKKKSLLVDLLTFVAIKKIYNDVNFFILFMTGSIVIFYNKSLTPLKIDNNKYAEVSTVFLQSSSGQKMNLKNENSEKMFADHYDQ